jgi:hypothetical protein
MGELLSQGEPSTKYFFEPLIAFNKKIIQAWSRDDYYNASQGKISQVFCEAECHTVQFNALDCVKGACNKQIGSNDSNHKGNKHEQSNQRRAPNEGVLVIFRS